MEKSAGMMAAIWVLLSVLGLVVLVGVILVMMLFGGGIQHSPTQRSELRNPVTVESLMLPSFQNREKGTV